MNNTQRAFWAESCLDHFAFLTGADATHDCATDLIADIGHLCRRHGIDFLAVVRAAVGHWHLELTDEDSLDPLPEVIITIKESIHR